MYDAFQAGRRCSRKGTSATKHLQKSVANSNAHHFAAKFAASAGAVPGVLGRQLLEAQEENLYFQIGDRVGNELDEWSQPRPRSMKPLCAPDLDGTRRCAETCRSGCHSTCLLRGRHAPVTPLRTTPPPPPMRQSVLPEDRKTWGQAAKGCQRMAEQTGNTHEPGAAVGYRCSAPLRLQPASRAATPGRRYRRLHRREASNPGGPKG